MLLKAILNKVTPSLTQEQLDKLLQLIQPPSVNHCNASTSKQVCSFNTAGPSSADTKGMKISHCFYSSICNNIALDTWIIDSGASHHICASLHWFHSYSEINPMIIKLPNGNHVTTKYAGTVVFSSSFSITNVLYVPTFTVNLISFFSIMDHWTLEPLSFSPLFALIYSKTKHLG